MLDFELLFLIYGSLPRYNRFLKRDRKQLNNYRPVSLTCITCKLLGHIIASSIHTFFDKNKILSDSQHGFRNDRSCETQLIHTFNDFALNKEKQLITNALILDFSTAFDSVNHWKLLFKLESLIICPVLISWIEKILIGRKQFVLVEGSE